MGEHRRFFIKPEDISGETAVLTGSAARQITKVLRLKEQDWVWVLDGSGNEHKARISSLSKGEVTATIVSTRTCPNEPNVCLTLAVCLPKHDKLELIVQKGTELGISEVVIVGSERTVALPNTRKLNDRLARWERIAAGATEQCGRGRIPLIRPMMKFGELTEEIAGFDLAVLAWEQETDTSLKDVLRKNAGVHSVMLIIGPEGGLTEGEVGRAKAAGAKCASLGKRLLRVETAAIAACAAVMYELGP